MEAADSVPKKDREHFDTHRNLAPYEHIVIGSTVEVEGGTFGSEDFFRTIREGGFGEVYRKPPIARDGVEQASNIRRGVHLDGALNLFTVEQVDIMFDFPGASPAYFPGELDKDGLVGDSFRVAIVDTKSGEIILPELLERLELNKEFVEGGFEIHREEDYIVVAPKAKIFK